MSLPGRAREAWRHVWTGHAATVVRERLIHLSSLSRPLRLAVYGSIAALVAIGILIALRRVLERSAELYVVAFPIHKGVVLSAGVIVVFALWFLITGLMFSNRTLRLIFVSLLILSSIALVPLAKWGPVRQPVAFLSFSEWWLLVAFEAGPLLLLVTALLVHKLRPWIISTLCGLACLITTAAVCFISIRYQPAFGAVVMTLSVLPFLFALLPALVTVGFDLVEWSMLFGGLSRDGLRQSRPLLMILLAAVAAIANLALATRTFDREDAAALATKAAIFAISLALLFYAFARAPGHETHLRRLQLLALATLILLAAIMPWNWSVRPGPENTDRGKRIFNYPGEYSFSVGYPKDWQVQVLKDKDNFSVKFSGPRRFLTIFAQSRAGAAPKLLNEIIPAGEQFPETPLRFAPQPNDWEKFETEIARTETRPRIGIELEDKGADTSINPLYEQAPPGAVVRGVRPNTPAAQSGLEALDLITAVDDQPIEKAQDISPLIRSKSEGQEVRLTVWRKGETIQIPVTVMSIKEGLPIHFAVWRKSVHSTDWYLNTDWYLLAYSSPTVFKEAGPEFESIKDTFLLSERSIPWEGRQKFVFFVWSGLTALFIIWMFRGQSVDRRWRAALLLVIGAMVLAHNVRRFRGEVEPLALSETFHCAQLIIAGASLLLLLWSWLTRHDRSVRRIESARIALFINVALLCTNGFFFAYDIGAQASEESYSWRALVIILAFAWEIVTSGDLTNYGTKSFPRASRILLLAGYVCLLAVCALLFVTTSYRYTGTMLGFDSEAYVTRGILLLGVPLLLTMLALHSQFVFGGGSKAMAEANHRNALPTPA
jgi:PDZ domain